jgi:hypothetical protein
LKQIIKKLDTIVEIDRERKQDSTIYVGCMCWLVAIIVTVGPFCEIPAEAWPILHKTRIHPFISLDILQLFKAYKSGPDT